MKRVFLTGGTGFIGAAVTRRLIDSGWTVALLVRPQAQTWRLGTALDKTHVIQGTFADRSTYDRELCRFAPEIVMHLAWNGVARELRNDPSQVRVNVAGTVDLFDAAVQAGCRHFIAAGSQAEYGPCSTRIDEDHPRRPRTLYGATKVASSMLLTQLARVHGVRLAWLRLFSVYGPQDAPGTMVSALIDQLLRGKRPALTAGKQIWDFLHVDDAAAAFVAVAEAGADGEMNVGAGAARPLLHTVKVIRDLIDPALELGIGEVAYEADAIMRLEPDIGRIQRATGWTPRIDLEEGLRATIAWQRNHVRSPLPGEASP
jgi:UDP-glucose 4-epimerase